MMPFTRLCSDQMHYDNLYWQMLAEPWVPKGIEPECLHDEPFAAFLSNIFDPDPKKAFRRNRGRWGLKSEQNLYDMCHRPLVHGLKIFRKSWRNFCHTLLPRSKMY